MGYISEISKVVKPEDTTIIFFSTHGNLNNNGEFYFSMAPEASSKNTWGNMKGKEFNQALTNLKGRILVLLDTCEAEGIINERLAENISYMVASKTSESSY